MNQIEKNSYLQSILDAFPNPVLIVDQNLKIYDFNHAARDLTDMGEEKIKRLCGQLLHCIYDRDTKAGCGFTEYCSDCVLRTTASAVEKGEHVLRKVSKMKLEKDGEDRDVWLMVTGAPFSNNGKNLVILTLEDITEVMELQSLLPICSHCKKVRNDDDYWQHVETYLNKHTRLRFSHGICPTCFKEHYPEHLK